jgi:hypothetical protein
MEESCGMLGVVMQDFSWSRAIVEERKKESRKVWQGTAFDLRK